MQTKVLPDYQTNPLRKYTPTWEKFNYIGGHMEHKWDCGADWLDDYTYYAEIIGDDIDDWWGTGLSTPSDGDADIPQPKVYRSYSKSNATMLDFVKCGASCQRLVLAKACCFWPRLDSSWILHHTTCAGLHCAPQPLCPSEARTLSADQIAGSRAHSESSDQCAQPFM